MTSRFGRNKRRRARAELAAATDQAGRLQEALEMQRGLTTHFREKHSDLAEVLAEVRECAGPLSALLPVEGKLKVAGDARRRVEVDVGEPMQFSVVDDPQALEMKTLERVPLEVLLTSIENDVMRRRVHLHVEFQDGHVAYAMDAQTIAGLPARVLAERLHTQITRQLVAQLMPMLLRGRS